MYLAFPFGKDSLAYTANKNETILKMFLFSKRNFHLDFFSLRSNSRQLVAETERVELNNRQCTRRFEQQAMENGCNSVWRAQ